MKCSCKLGAKNRNLNGDDDDDDASLFVGPAGKSSFLITLS